MVGGSTLYLGSVKLLCTYLLALPLLASALRLPLRSIPSRPISGAGTRWWSADLNRDGKPDLIALASGMNELVWYENPTWQRHVIARGVSRMINCVVVDERRRVYRRSCWPASSRSGGEQPGSGLGAPPNGDPRQPWTIREIDRLPTSHRLRLADIDGSGKKVVVNAPLTGAKAEAPDYRGQTPLVFYRPGEWKRQLISEENSGVVHGIYIVDWDGDGRDEILTASFSGIHLFKLGKDGRWTRTEIAKGDPAPWPKSGSSDMAVGHLARSASWRPSSHGMATRW